MECPKEAVLQDLTEAIKGLWLSAPDCPKPDIILERHPILARAHRLGLLS